MKAWIYRWGLKKDFPIAWAAGGNLGDVGWTGDPWRGTSKRGENHTEALLEKGENRNHQSMHLQKEPGRRQGSGRAHGGVFLGTAIGCSTTHSGIRCRRKSCIPVPGHWAKPKPCLWTPLATHSCAPAPRGSGGDHYSPRADT